MSELSVLYHKGKENKLYQWEIWTEGDEIVTEHGRVGGKLQQARKTAKAKNVGRSNETTPEQQAELEARAMWQFKVDRKYSETPEEAEQTLFLPMLAKPFEGAKKVVYPVDVQPKLDGVRALAAWDGDSVTLTSRSGKPYNLPHITNLLEYILPRDRILDGEVYLDEATFQQVTSLVKKERVEPTETLPFVTQQLNYHVYDIIMRGTRDTDVPWALRKQQLDEFFDSFDPDDAPHIKSVATVTDVGTAEAVQELEKAFVGDGYEGAIVRVPYGFPYIYGYRSAGLLKVKSFTDEEFEIVGYTFGDGKMENVPTWVCQLADGREFRCLSKGTQEYREQLGQEADYHIGEMLKVKFFEKTDDGIPRFPVGIGFRIPEDQ